MRKSDMELPLFRLNGEVIRIEKNSTTRFFDFSHLIGVLVFIP